MEIEVTAMQRISEPKPNKSGDIIVASFNANIGPMTLRNCVLVELYNRGGEHYKGMTVWGPHITTRNGARGVSFRDREVQRELCDQAVDVFVALGGKVEEKPEGLEHGPTVPGIMVV